MLMQPGQKSTAHPAHRVLLLTTLVFALVVWALGWSRPVAADSTADSTADATAAQSATRDLRQIIPPVASPSPVDGQGALTPAPTSLPNTWRIADTGGIPARVRSAPSLDAAVVMRVEPGTVVEPLNEMANADGYSWRKISVDGAVGWIVTSLLLEPPPPPRTIVYEVAAVGERGLNFRAAPSTTVPILDSLAERTVVEPVGAPTEAEGRQWRQIRVNGVTGWVIAEAIRER